MNKIQYLIILIIPLFNIIINLLFLIIILNLRNKKNQKNFLFYNSYSNSISNIKKNSKTIIEKIYLYILYFSFYLLDLPINLIRLCFKEKNSTVSNYIEIYVFLYLIFAIIIFYFNIYNFFVLGYLIWRISLINITKLQMISAISQKFLSKKNKFISSILSFNRNFILTIINLLELIYIFSIFYYNMNVSNKNNFDLLLNTLKIFLTFEADSSMFFNCLIQKIIYLIQIITSIIFIILFISNLTNLYYKENKK